MSGPITETKSGNSYTAAVELAKAALILGAVMDPSLSLVETAAGSEKLFNITLELGDVAGPRLTPELFGHTTRDSLGVVTPDSLGAGAAGQELKPIKIIEPESRR